MATAHNILLDWWKATGEVPDAAAVGDAFVQELEQRYGLTLPEDLRAYITSIAPQEDFWDDGDAIWWSPSRIKSIPDEYEHAIKNAAIAEKAGSYLFFADYMIWCWAWAICCDDSSDRGKVAVITGTDDRIVADTFTDFVKAYITDSLSVS